MRYDPIEDKVITMNSRLPGARGFTSAVWTGSIAYVFGGIDGSYVNEILAFDPRNDTLESLPAKLPYGRVGSSAIWDGTAAYVFGGLLGTGAQSPDNNVWRLASHRSAALVNELIFGDTGGIVWDQSRDSRIYVDAGEVSLVPARFTAPIIASRLPLDGDTTVRFKARYSGSVPYSFFVAISTQEELGAARDYDATIPFDNWGGANRISTTYQEYELTVRGSTISLYKAGVLLGSTELAGARWLMWATGTGEDRALHLDDIEITDANGSIVLTEPFTMDGIIKFDPSAARPRLLPVDLASRRSYTSAVWDGQDAYVFGGWVGKSLNEVVRFSPSNGTVSITNARLPSSAGYTAAYWNGSRAVIVGGRHFESQLKVLQDVTYYDPATDEAYFEGVLPTPRCCGTSVEIGDRIYSFGGRDFGSSSQILAYNPGTRRWNVAGFLPSERAWASAVTDGSVAYVFGGRDGFGNGLSEVVRFDPADGSSVVLNGRLPFGNHQIAAVWDGQRAYLFGGCNAWSGFGYPSDLILRYDPDLDQVTTLDVRLPTPRCSMAFAWNGTHAVLFGGRDSGDRLDEVLIFSPQTETLEVSSLRLPNRTEQAGGVWTGSKFLLFGGRSDDAGFPASDRAIEIDFAGNTSRIHYGMLPAPRTEMSAVWRGPNAFLFGGLVCRPSCVLSNEILVAGLAPSPPWFMHAYTGPGDGQTALAWLGPKDGDPVTEYRIYRSESGEPRTLAGTSTTTTFFDTGLQPGRYYHYRVTAVGPGGESLPSNPSGALPSWATVSPAPLDFYARRDVDSTAAVLTWNAPPSEGRPPLLAYRVYRSAPGGNFSALADVSAMARTYSDTTALPTNEYYYRLAARNSLGVGPQTGSVRVPTKPNLVVEVTEDQVAVYDDTNDNDSPEGGDLGVVFRPEWVGL